MQSSPSFSDKPPTPVATAWSQRTLTLSVLAFLALLYVPLAGNYGLWDPWETHYGEVARQMVWHAAALRTAGEPCLKEASMAKLFCSEAAFRVADRAVQVLGAMPWIEDQLVGGPWFAPVIGISVANAVLARVALRSVPGAILVGGGILAKRLHDKRKARLAAEREAKAESPLLAPEPKE